MALMTIAKGKSKISERIFENRMNHVDLLSRMGASIEVKNNTAYIIGVNKLKGMKLVGSDLRSSAALIIAALISEDMSLFYGLEHLDRGYEQFEAKLSKLGAIIKRENDDTIINESKNKEKKVIDGNKFNDLDLKVA